MWFWRPVRIRLARQPGSAVATIFPCRWWVRAAFRGLSDGAERPETSESNSSFPKWPKVSTLILKNSRFLEIQRGAKLYATDKSGKQSMPSTRFEISLSNGVIVFRCDEIGTLSGSQPEGRRFKSYLRNQFLRRHGVLPELNYR